MAQENEHEAQHVDRVFHRRPPRGASEIVSRPRLPWSVPRGDQVLNTESPSTKHYDGFNGTKRLVSRKERDARAIRNLHSEKSFENATDERYGSESNLQPDAAGYPIRNIRPLPSPAIGNVKNPLNSGRGWTSTAAIELTPEEEKLKQELSEKSQVPIRQNLFNKQEQRERAWPEKRREKLLEASNRSIDQILRKVDTAKVSTSDGVASERHGHYKCSDCGRWNNYERNQVCFNCQAPPDSGIQANSDSETFRLGHLALRRLGSWNCHCGKANFPTRKACHFCGKQRDLSQISSHVENIEDGVVLKDILCGTREDSIEAAWQWKHLRRRTNAEDKSKVQFEQESPQLDSDVESHLDSHRIAQERAERSRRSQDGSFVGFVSPQDKMSIAEIEQLGIISPSFEQSYLTDSKAAAFVTTGAGFVQQQDGSDRFESPKKYSPERTVETEFRMRQNGYPAPVPQQKPVQTNGEVQPIARSYRGLENAPDRNRVRDRQRAQRNIRDSGDEYENIDEAIVTRIERKRQRKKEKIADRSLGTPTPILLPEYISIGNLATALRVRAEDFSLKMRSLGFEETNNDHILDAETAGLIASEFNFEPIVPRKENAVEDLIALPRAEDKTFLLQRPPVITIMGHVDHGKTTLLDWLRKSSVAASEHGGITQHIGAFTVPMPSGRIITFLDTPGHAAFLSMRQRGANVTDIVILVVAADDSVKPQTIEAIRHAQAAKVPIIVAINKIDKPESDIERVKQDLARHGVDIEDFGGETQVVCISGKTGQGMEELEDSAVALADVLDMRAETDGQAEGWVLEATTRKAGRVATVLIRRGTVFPGSILVAGTTWTRIRSLRNEAGMSISSAGPGTPVEIDGWREQPEAGNEVLQALDEQRAKAVVELRLARAEKEKMATDVIAVNEARRLEQEKREREATVSVDSSSDTGDKPSPQPIGIVEIPFIIRGDVSGSVEAVVNSVSSLGNGEVRPTILRSAVGPIAPTDVEHAAAAKGHIISFNTPIDGNIRRMAEAAGVSILDQNIIYRLTDDVKAKLEEVLPTLLTTRVVGEAEVAEVFEINVKGRVTVPVAGCKVRNGVVSKGTKIRILRAGKVVYDGTKI